MKKLRILFFMIVLAFANVTMSTAQCAMCRATVESNSSSGNKAIGRGLNAGILYLLSIPYILVSVVGYLWYTNSKKNSRRIASTKHVKGKLPPMQEG